MTRQDSRQHASALALAPHQATEEQHREALIRSQEACKVLSQSCCVFTLQVHVPEVRVVKVGFFNMKIPEHTVHPNSLDAAAVRKVVRLRDEKA